MLENSILQQSDSRNGPWWQNAFLFRDPPCSCFTYVATTPIDLFTHMVQKPVMQAIISYISLICCENWPGRWKHVENMLLPSALMHLLSLVRGFSGDLFVVWIFFPGVQHLSPFQASLHVFAFECCFWIMHLVAWIICEQWKGFRNCQH